MTWCRRCEVSWVGHAVCWIPGCGRVGEAGGFPKSWLTADDGAETRARIAGFRAEAKAWRAEVRAS